MVVIYDSFINKAYVRTLFNNKRDNLVKIVFCVVVDINIIYYCQVCGKSIECAGVEIIKSEFFGEQACN